MTMNWKSAHWGRRYETKNWKRGDVVGFADLDQAPIDVPSSPKFWYVLRTHANRERKVMRAFERDVISAYLPMQQRVIDRRTGNEARKPHLGRTIVSPIVPGLIFIPDFEMDRSFMRIRSTDGADEFVKFGDRFACLRQHDFRELRAIEAWLSIPRGKRKFSVGESVIIGDGLFKDFLGLVERLDSGGRLKVFLCALERGVSIILNETQVQLAASATSEKIARPLTVQADQAPT